MFSSNFWPKSKNGLRALVSMGKGEDYWYVQRSDFLWFKKRC